MPPIKDTKSVKSKKPVKLQAELPEGRTIIYPVYDVILFSNDQEKAPKSAGAMTSQDAKELLGWQDENDFIGELKKLNGKDTKASFGSQYLMLDRHQVKVRCSHNLHNRPFNSGLANDWMLEILNKKWRLNGETVIIDKYGDIQDGQHRLVGLIWAVQEWWKDQKKPKAERKWGAWDQEPTIETVVFCGIEADDETVNTIGVGKPRTLEDALARCSWFASLPDAARLATAKTARYAVKFLQYRTAQEHLDSAKRSHSEAFAFIERHSRLLDCVKFVHEENDNGKLGKLIPLGYAAGLLYLMGACATKDEDYRAINNESCIDWELWDMAQSFWVDLSSNGKATEALREELMDDLVEITGGKLGMDWKSGLVIKAWNLYVEGEPVTAKAIAMEQDHDEDEKIVLTESPSCGGIDIVYSID